jgi:hypothetical protein
MESRPDTCTFELRFFVDLSAPLGKFEDARNSIIHAVAASFASFLITLPWEQTTQMYDLHINLY